MYICESCNSEFRYYKKIISCAVCGAMNSIIEKNATINKKMVIETLNMAHFTIKWSGNPQNQGLTLRLEDAINYLKENLK
ncbi:MAG: hypothetical protein R2685_07990 [Candidatus Nitrosocosmicus sp.]|nr:hypothetical protein [Candidatus Nitrosocosmicus sp.]